MILAASWASAARAPSCAASPPRPASRSLLRLFPESFDFIFAPCKICRLEELLHLKCFGLRGRRAGCGHVAGRPALGERSPEKNDELFEQAAVVRGRPSAGRQPARASSAYGTEIQDRSARAMLRAALPRAAAASFRVRAR